MNYLKIYEEEHIKNRLSYSQIREKYNISRGTWDYWIRQKLGKSADQRKYVCKDDFFDNIYSAYKIKRVEATRMINCNSEARGKIKELLISNF